MIRMICALLSGILAISWASVALAQAPTVVSITPVSVGPSAAATETFTVIFSEAVTGVDTGDFELTTTGSVTASISSTSGSADAYTLSVNAISGAGTLRLDLKAAGTGIVSSALVPIAGGFTGGTVRTSILPPAPVPTLSEWAMILLGALIAGGGALYIQRSRSLA